MVVGVEEQLKVLVELLVALVVVAFDGCFLEGAVHPLDLTIGPRMVRLRQSMFDAMLVADVIKQVRNVLSRWA